MLIFSKIIIKKHQSKDTVFMVLSNDLKIILIKCDLRGNRYFWWIFHKRFMFQILVLKMNKKEKQSPKYKGKKSRTKNALDFKQQEATPCQSTSKFCFVQIFFLFFLLFFFSFCFISSFYYM